MAVVGSRTPILCLLLISFFILLFSRSHPLGLREIAFWGGRFILILALVTLAISYFTRYLSSFRPTSHSQTVSQDEMDRQQEITRKGQQEYLKKKAREYSEDVLKPREAEKLRKQEETFYRMTGQTWKLTQGHQLGEAEESEGNVDSEDNEVETANERAIRRRKLPEHVTKPVPKVEQPQPKKVITLPEEPDELEVGVVTIALRCPSGRVYKRRFYKAYSSLVLQDWMMKIGYHTAFYTICTSLPKCYLELRKDLTLENIGITNHTVLNVEGKDIL
ncbi:PREDICTED: UBX domain-containing protein 8 isoform X2 [Nanorana parkeri]|uniref:UBX domain-containing protein 8 isoform X2 n=1 Tax=Nanorana parkeri TaxID=125878 RepID=UPI000853FAF3|nr:PREDICTED: UBX domain-containing protein 8 isoform X2 [Nanorana parkeri]